jgi:hypothetical protein
MAGPDHITSELLKGAHVKVRTQDGHDWHDYLLAGELATLFQHSFSTGLLPPVWCDAILCAIFKKGEPSVYDNYRGIAEGSLMGKIYCMLVEARLDRFCEDHGYRATGQAGFRRKRACSDHVFILKHLIDRTRADARRNLFVCFVDFRKVYI